MEEKYKQNFMEKEHGKPLLGEPKTKSEDNIRMYLMKEGCEDAGGPDSETRLTAGLVLAVLNLRVLLPKN
jgi:hypothetical protein